MDRTIKAGLLAFPTFVGLLILVEYNGICQQKYCYLKEEVGITVARQLVIYTRFPIISGFRRKPLPFLIKKSSKELIEWKVRK